MERQAPAENHARVGRSRMNDPSIAETAPLLAETSPEALLNETDGFDGHERPWLGSDEFSRKPAWRRPSV